VAVLKSVLKFSGLGSMSLDQLVQFGLVVAGGQEHLGVRRLLEGNQSLDLFLQVPDLVVLLLFVALELHGQLALSLERHLVLEEIVLLVFDFLQVLLDLLLQFLLVVHKVGDLLALVFDDFFLFFDFPFGVKGFLSFLFESLLDCLELVCCRLEGSA
jgi:hypothetical protein